ncbi:MAG TPA: hypothetical protein VM012_01705, partial [Flavitalea sp.]|nr:hypothetical protein [Flavitalea sp.]
EFALDHIDEGYVMILGDDDGLYRNAVDKVALLLQQHQAEAICWGYAPYLWPGIGNLFYHPLFDEVGFRTTAEVLQEVKTDVGKIRALPGFYWGFIDIRYYKMIKQRDGQFFNSSIPDYYAASILAGVISRYLYTDAAFSIGGTSPKSLGVSFVSPDAQKSNGRNEFFAQLDKPVHKRIVFGIDGITALADPYLHAQERSSQLPVLDIKCVLAKALTLVSHGASFQKYQQTVPVLKEIASRNSLQSDFEILLKMHPFVHRDKASKKGSYSIGLNAVRFFPAEYGITNVYDVSLLGSRYQPDVRFTGSYRKNKFTNILSRLKGICYVTWLCLFSDERKYLLRRYLYSFIGK